MYPFYMSFDLSVHVDDVDVDVDLGSIDVYQKYGKKTYGRKEGSQNAC